MKYNAGNAKPIQFSVAPQGNYHVVITGAEEKVSSNGNDMVKVTCQIDEGQFDGAKIWHNVTFLDPESKAAGLALHFLHTIGQPYQGEFEIKTSEWLGRRFLANIGVEEYNGKKKNVINGLTVPSDGKLENPKYKRGPSEEEPPF